MEHFQPVPIESLNWKTVSDFELVTPLGVDDCTVQILDINGPQRVLKAGEENRIRKSQTKIFCEWIIESKSVISSEQLTYILNLFSLKQVTVARALLLSDGAISQYLKGTTRITENLSRQIALLILREIEEPQAIQRLAQNKKPLHALFSNVPIKDLSDRGWIEYQSPSQIPDAIFAFFRGALDQFELLEKDLAVRYRKSFAYDSSATALVCWLQGIRNIINKTPPLIKYEQSNLIEVLPELLNLASEEGGVSQIKSILNRVGVHFIIEPNFKGTHVDGATFFEDGSPVIVLTLRYDRIDSFWHTLLHEIAHIVLGHDISGARLEGLSASEELEENAAIIKDAEENEADQWAANKILPKEKLMSFSSSLKGLPKRLNELGAATKRHPGIVAGRLQFEKILPFASKECAKAKVRVSHHLKDDLSQYHISLIEEKLKKQSLKN